LILFSPATFEIDDEKAAIFGAGCWAQDRTGTTDGMACSISGTGEEIVRANLARSIGAAYKSRAEPHQILQRTLMDLLSEPIHASISRRESDFFFLSRRARKSGDGRASRRSADDNERICNRLDSTEPCCRK